MPGTTTDPGQAVIVPEIVDAVPIGKVRVVAFPGGYYEPEVRGSMLVDDVLRLIGLVPHDFTVRRNNELVPQGSQAFVVPGDQLLVVFPLAGA